jgi:hypothetical protein
VGIRVKSIRGFFARFAQIVPTPLLPNLAVMASSKFSCSAEAFAKGDYVSPGFKTINVGNWYFSAFTSDLQSFISMFPKQNAWTIRKHKEPFISKTNQAQLVHRFKLSRVRLSNA